MIRFVQVLLILGVAFAAWSHSVASSRPVEWRENIQAARKESRQTKKMLFVYFHMPTCGPCHQLEEGALHSAAVREASAGFTPLKVDVTTPEGSAFAQRYGVRGVPYLAVIGPDGRIRENLISVVPPEDVVEMLKNAARK